MKREDYVRDRRQRIAEADRLGTEKSWPGWIGRFVAWYYRLLLGKDA